ncbi:MAG: hypothetical protein KAT62_00765 [Desulfuromonadales bacterium]|nr:hypothetical protein [Desulfuromonadales bacterium]
MGVASNAKVQIESGQSLTEFEALTDVGSQQVFNPSAALMSSVIAPVIRPDGLVTGVNLITPHADDDKVAVAAFTANSQGVLKSVAAGAVSITRPATDVAKVNSITMTSAGALAEVAGTDGTDGNFSEVRGNAGGPPYIPVGSVELGQVRLTALAAGVVTASEIKQNGQYTEFANYPVFTVNPVGLGLVASESGTTNAFVKFSAALDTRHTADVTKGVYGQYYVPSFADVPRASDFSPAETSHSVSSEETYDGPVGSSSSSLGQAGFSAMLDDGVNDLIVNNKDKNLTVKFFPNRNASANIVTQGKVGIARSFPVSGQISASCTISAEVASAEFAA